MSPVVLAVPIAGTCPADPLVSLPARVLLGVVVPVRALCQQAVVPSVVLGRSDWLQVSGPAAVLPLAALHDVVQIGPVLRDRSYQEAVGKNVRRDVDDLVVLAVGELPVAARRAIPGPEPVIWSDVHEAPELVFQGETSAVLHPFGITSGLPALVVPIAPATPNWLPLTPRDAAHAVQSNTGGC